MTSTPIAAQVDDLAATMRARLPGGTPEAFAREQADLAAAGVPDGVIRPGAALPDAELLAADGTPTTLRAAAGGRPAVVVFYRGAWCPYCNIALRTYQDRLLPELAARNVQLIAVSPQRPDGSLTMQEKHELAFPVLSDPGNTLARAAGILTAPSDGARAAQLELGLDLTQVNADGTTGLPMPATVVLDAEHTVRWIDVHPDYTGRSEPEQILAGLDAAGL
jgi:peroxiredoxin